MPQKRYIVRLTAQEREVCRETLRKLNGSSEKVRRAQVLLKADADGPAWTDERIADAFSCRTKTVENIRLPACGKSRAWTRRIELRVLHCMAWRWARDRGRGRRHRCG